MEGLKYRVFTLKAFVAAKTPLMGKNKKTFSFTVAKAETQDCL